MSKEKRKSYPEFLRHFHVVECEGLAIPENMPEIRFKDQFVYGKTITVSRLVTGNITPVFFERGQRLSKMVAFTQGVALIHSFETALLEEGET